MGTPHRKNIRINGIIYGKIGDALPDEPAAEATGNDAHFNQAPPDDDAFFNQACPEPAEWDCEG